MRQWFFDPRRLAPLAAVLALAVGGCEVGVTEPPPCQPLRLVHHGPGDDPLADPLSSPRCPQGTYEAGQVVSLAATPADPAKAPLVRWRGTDDDSRSGPANTCTMGRRPHTVWAVYWQPGDDRDDDDGDGDDGGGDGGRTDWDEFPVP